MYVVKATFLGYPGTSKVTPSGICSREEGAAHAKRKPAPRMHVRRIAQVTFFIVYGWSLCLWLLAEFLQWKT